VTTDSIKRLGTRAQATGQNSARPALSFISVRRTIAMVATFVVAAAAWWWVAPPPLGGQTTIVTVDGTSMRPGLTQSDVVIIRPAAEYQVGDVVAYRSAMLHRIVLHRIVAIDGDHFTFKGDNNSFVDPENPNRTALVGKRWITAPGVARFLGVLRLPIVLALLAAGAVLYQGVIGGAGGRREHNLPGR
jgi:signal peptidase I